MRVSQIMSRPVISCDPDDTLERAAHLMWEEDIGFVVVLDEGRLAGVITDRDICMGAYTQGLPLRFIPVRASMSRNVFTVEQGEDVEAAERMMAEKQVRRLPVVDEEGKVIGVLSLNDVAREAQRELGLRSPEVDSHALSSALGRISAPRRPMVVSLPNA